MCGTCFSQCFAFSTRHPSHSTLCSQPRSHSRHSTFCHFPRATHATDTAICVYGVPKRNRPRQTVCSSNTSLRQTLPCSSQALLRPQTFLQLQQQALKPWQCLFMEAQRCRLPGFKTRQTFPCSSQAPLWPRHAPTSP